ncbi:MAG: methyltransferase domain-containing protein [Chloroflexi bacterium]|nr:methyltransferase domain-containing protein [Chloroflexota bacterium]
MRAALRRAVRFFGARAPGGGRVLDVGSGGGHLAAALERPGRPVVAVDVSLTYARAARRRYDRLRVVVGDALALPFPDATFAAVCSHEHVEHLADPRGGLAEEWRVLAPGGRLLLVAPNLGGPLPALNYALYLLRHGLVWQPSPIDGARLPGLLAEVARNTLWTLGRCLGAGPTFAARTPDLSGPPHGDSDATWWCNSRDLWRALAALGARRRLRCAGRTGWLGPFAATVYIAADKPASGLNSRQGPAER